MTTLETRPNILTVPFDTERYPTLGPEVVAFMEDNLVFGPGDLRGEPFRLDEEQRGYIYRFYEIFGKGHPLEGRRRFQQCGLSLGKGLRKTEILAAVAAVELHAASPVRFAGWDKSGRPLGRPVTDPVVLLIASTEEQSDELAYGTLKVMLEEGPLRSDFDIGLTRIMRLKGDGVAKSLAGSPNARDGGRTTFAGLDETHWWVLPRMHQAKQTVVSNLTKRPIAEPWCLETTTAFDPGAGSVAQGTFEYAEAIRKETAKGDRFFFYHRGAKDELDIEEEEQAREAVVQASGPAVAWRDIEAIMVQWADPRTDRAWWDRVFANRIVKASSKAFDAKLWDSLKATANPVKDGDLITLGFDGAIFRDSTGLVGTHVATGYQWVVGEWEKPYGAGDDWHVPEEEVDAVVCAAFGRWNVWRLYADPPYWQAWLAKWVGQFGAEKVVGWWTNRRKPMTSALEAFETGMRSKAISHDGSRVLSRHVGNAHKHELPQRDEDGRPLWLIRKERSDSPNKIDLAMAAVLSWEARTDAIAAGALNERRSDPGVGGIPGVFF